jgi:hypothetical protein
MAKNKNFQQAKNAINKKDKDNESKSKSQGTNPWAVGLVILLAVALVATLGQGTGQPQDTGIPVGSYRGETISWAPNSDYDNVANRLFSRYTNNPQFDNAQFLSFFLEESYRQALSNVVMSRYYEYLARENNIIASDYRIKEEIKQLDEFKVNGLFSERQYNSASQETILSYYQALEEVYTLGRIQDVLFTGNAVNPALENLIEEQSKDQRKLEWVVYDDGDFPLDTLETFAQENAELFRSVELSRITILDSRAAAEEVLALIEAGDQTFGEIALNNSQDSQAVAQGSLGLKFAYEIYEELPEESDREALLSLNQGDITQIFETFTGFAIYQLDSDVQTMDFSNPEVQAKIKSYLRTRETGVYTDGLLSLAQEKQEAGIWNVSALGKDINESDFFAINVDGFENIDGINSVAAGTALGDLQTTDFYRTVFDAEIGSIIDPVLTNSSTVLLARVVDERTLEEVDKSAEINRSILEGRQLTLQEQIMASDDVENLFAANWPQILQRLQSQR